MSKAQDAARTNELLKIAGLTVEKLTELIKELLRSGVSNPLLGLTGSIIITDMLNRAGLVSNGARNIILVAVGAVTAAETAGSILEDLVPFKNNTNELMPSATTVVFGGSDSSKELSGLIESTKGEKK